MPNTNTDLKSACFHCGDDCPDKAITSGENNFCCRGCLAVYTLLSDGELGEYYHIESNPGLRPSSKTGEEFAYLDEPKTRHQLHDFENETIGKITLLIPQIHCLSCIWLLENLARLDAGVIQARVNFPKRQLSLTYLKKDTSLRSVVETLTSLGYEPEITLGSLKKKPKTRQTQKLYLRLGVAGFCFANIMLLSFPEYLSGNSRLDPDYQRLFGILNIILSLPVLLLSAREFFSPAINGLNKRVINIDLPISIGIVVLFTRSLVEILSATGSGFMDSFAGLVFFLLIGRVFQQKTYDSLNFERDYKSYFPISVLRKEAGREKTIPLSQLKTGNRILIRNSEIIPADSILISSRAIIDYSFVTGESEPVAANEGSVVYAGGRQRGEIIELETVKEVSQSYLTELWNNKAFGQTTDSRFTSLSNRISKYFTWAILSLAAITTCYWLIVDPSLAANAATAVLIIACPCALALSSPFALGTATRIMGRAGLFLKNSDTVEAMASIDTIVFDKTGTLTKSGDAAANYSGDTLDEYETGLVKSLVKHSSHPLSRHIYDSLTGGGEYRTFSFCEIAGQGLEAIIDGRNVRLGSHAWIQPEGNSGQDNSEINGTRIYLSISEGSSGYFTISNTYRNGLLNTIGDLSSKYLTHLLSGDNDTERSRLKQIFSKHSKLRFDQSPTDKLSFIDDLTRSGRKVLMLGDGLNDAGALKKSTVGISVSEDISAFAPACNGILKAASLVRFQDFLSLAKSSVLIIKSSFAISFLYNIVGLYFAVRGELSPVIAAILMPLSSITVVTFATISLVLIARRKNLG